MPGRGPTRTKPVNFRRTTGQRPQGSYVAHLADASTLRVSCVDRLHNARAILSDLQVHADGVWSRFSAGKDEVVWCYGALADAFTTNKGGPAAAELRQTVDEPARVAARVGPGGGSGRQPPPPSKPTS